jgi:hypothetical protein
MKKIELGKGIEDVGRSSALHRPSGRLPGDSDTGLDL